MANAISSRPGGGVRDPALPPQVFGNDVGEHRRYLFAERFPATLTDPDVWVDDFQLGDDPGHGETHRGDGLRVGRRPADLSASFRWM